MILEARSFDDLIEAFRNLDRGEVDQCEPEWYRADDAYSYEDLSTFPHGAVRRALFRMSEGGSKLWEKPERFAASWPTMPNVIGTWNSRGTGRWISGDNWVITEGTVYQEQDGSSVAAVLGAREVTDGWATVVFPRHDREGFEQVFGVSEWPSEGWHEVEVWYGE